MEIYGEHYGGPASGIWCERCRRAGHEVKMRAAREPRRFNGFCDTCCWFGHLSCDCFLQRDRIYSDVPTLPFPPQSNRGGPGYDIPCYLPQQTPPSYSGRSGGSGYDIPCYSPQQPAPRPFSSFDRGQRCNGGHSITPPQHKYCGSKNSYGTNEGPQQQYGRGADGSAGYGATFPQEQPGPRPFSSFGWEQRYACRDGPPVNGLANSIAQGQTQRDVEMDCHGGAVSKVSGPPETTASLARGGPPLQVRHQRRLQPPSGNLSPPTVVISDSASEQWLQSDNMEIPMFSPSEGPQQSAPTAVILSAAAPAAEAVTGTRVFPAVSPKGVAEAPASSAGAALAAVPAAAPATGGTVFLTASVGGAARAPTSADGIAALTAAPATGGTVPFATSVGGAPASSAVAAASAEAVKPATSGNVPSAASVRGAVGARESSAGAVPSDAATEAAPSTDRIAAPAASTAREARALASAAGSDGEICGKRGASTHPFDPGTVCPLEVHYYNGSWLQHGSSSGSSSRSSNDNTSDHDSWWDATCVGALLRPFDPGKLCRRSTRRAKAVLGVDLPFDRGKAWGRMQHGG